MKPVTAFVPTSLTLVWIHRVSLGVCSTGTHIQLCVVSSKFLARWTSPQKRRNYFLRRARGRLSQAQGAGHVPTPFTMLFCSPKKRTNKIRPLLVTLGAYVCVSLFAQVYRLPSKSKIYGVWVKLEREWIFFVHSSNSGNCYMIG